jgi:hypothetical protein
LGSHHERGEQEHLNLLSRAELPTFAESVKRSLLKIVGDQPNFKR